MMLLTYVVVLVLMIISNANGLFQFPSNKRATLISNILKLADITERGLIETSEQNLQMKNLFEQLEKQNPNKASLSSPLVNKVWELRYTTSSAILGRGQQKRLGPILQSIDAINLKAVNSETVDYGILKVGRKVTADLSPMSKSKVAVQFKQFSIGPITFNAPSSFKGELDVTYLDKEVRLSRGDKGNIFVLTSYSDL